MILRVVFRRAARREFDDAADRYDEQRPGLGEEFIFEIDQAIVKAAASPERYPIVFDDIRRTVARRFPYFLVDAILRYGSAGYNCSLVRTPIGAAQFGRWANRGAR